MRHKLVIVMSVIMSCLSVYGQTQQGYVKTKGRLGSNGTVIAGTRLQGATVSVRGGNSVVSGSNGTFFLSIPTSSYYLQNVQKQGYVLTDPDVLSKQYACSKNPLVLVLEDKEQQKADMRAIERKISSNLYSQLQKRSDELEALKEKNKITEEKYRELLQKLNRDQDENEKLISEMADRYSKMDFDEVDDFNRRISSLILEGRLTEADSLLNTKGDINTRAATLRQHQEANAKAEQELKKKQKKLEKSKALTQKELEDLVQDCYSKFEIFKMLHKNDSAAYYIELSANLDTTDIEMQNVSGHYFRIFMGDLEKALLYYQRVLRFSIAQHNNNWISNGYNNVGLVFKLQGNYKKAIDYYKMALNKKDTTLLNGITDIATINFNIGSIYYKEENYTKALEYYNNAMSVNNVMVDSALMALLYENIGLVYHRQKDYDKTMEYYNKALIIREQSINVDSLDIARSYHNMGSLYFNQNSLDQAFQYISKSLEIRKRILGNMHPEVASCYQNIGGVLIKKQDYQQALMYLNHALSIKEKIYGKEHLDVASTCGLFGVLYESQNKFTQSLQYYERALAIRKKILGEEHIRVKETIKKIDRIRQYITTYEP